MVRSASTVLLILGLATAALLWSGPGDSHQPALAKTLDPAAAAADSWTFILNDIQDLPREGETEEMFGFLFDVGAFGIPELKRSWKLRGSPPRFRPHPDSARTYRWELLDSRGILLDSGKHLDKIALYTSTENGPCLKSTVQDHGMLIRCVFHPAAQRLRITLAGSQTAHHDEEHGH
ncbi:MAG: hypothetical protein V3W41_15455 [Planctomycetota bacterium]